MKLRFTPALLLLITTACSSLHKQAEELMEAGAYDQAENTYAEILKDDPKDAEANEGLRLAREKLVSQRLIEVRLARMSGNFDKSHKILLDIVERQNQWGYYPKGRVAFTQGEETQEHLNYLKLLIDQSLDQKLPLKSQAILLKYAPIYRGRWVNELHQLGLKTENAGAADCDHRLRTAKKGTPFYNLFLNRYCEFFKSSKRVNKDWLTLPAHAFYNAVDVRVEIDRLPQKQRLAFRSQIEEQFRSSPWFDPSGAQTLKISLSGRYRERVRKEKIPLVHSYEVQIPYTEEVPVTLIKNTTTHSSKTVTDPVSGKTQTMPVTNHHRDQVVEVHRATKYRMEPRFVHFSGWKATQTGLLDIHTQFETLKRRSDFGFEKSIEHQDITHDQYMGHVGLSPDPLQLRDLQSWLDQQVHVYSQGSQNELDRSWMNDLCQFSSQGATQSANRANQVLHCARANFKPGREPKVVDQWFEKDLGVDYQTARLVLDSGDWQIGLK